MFDRKFQRIFCTGGPRIVRILGPGKNRTSEIRTSRYYIVNFHQYEFYYIGKARNYTSTNFIPIAPKIVLAEFVLVETVLVGDTLQFRKNIFEQNQITYIPVCFKYTYHRQTEALNWKAIVIAVAIKPRKSPIHLNFIEEPKKMAVVPQSYLMKRTGNERQFQLCSHAQNSKSFSARLSLDQHRLLSFQMG